MFHCFEEIRGPSLVRLEYLCNRPIAKDYIMKSISAAAALLAALPAAYAQGQYGPSNGGSSQQCSTITADEIRSMGNNSLFTRWRPYSHVSAPAGWMNDPCAPMYDPTTETYFIMYQWHPYHINWGNISWGYATSKDLITWTDHDSWQGNDALAMGPFGETSTTTNGDYASLGIFSGTGQPYNLQGEQDGTLTLFYTCVSYLPTNWAIPYHPHTEQQCVATSTDGGKTFQQYEGNPIINATTETAPMYWNVTGFRDPFVEPWPEMDALLGNAEPHFYMVLGSGIKGVGPRIPFWSAPATDLTDWTFLGALFEPVENSTLGPVLSTGVYGFNFEVSGFYNLVDSEGLDHYFVTMGAEGGNVSFHGRWALWNEGVVNRRENGSAQFTPIAGGAADWGIAYAITSFLDTKHNNRRIQWTWVSEDIVGDGGNFAATQQGFQGALGFSREIFVHDVKGVSGANGSLAQSKEAVLSQSGTTFTARTHGFRPASDVVAGLRSTASHHSYSPGSVSSSSILEQSGSNYLELKATIKSTTGAAGVRVGVSPSGDEYTTIMYEPSNNTILVERLHSSNIVEFNNGTVTGFFLPYTMASTGQPESITMDVFVDGSLVEVFVNERFAMSTRIYPSNTCSNGYGVYVADGAEATFASVDAWLGLANVWPDRPLNSSSQLVLDTVAQTNNYTWWPGN